MDYADTYDPGATPDKDAAYVRETLDATVMDAPRLAAARLALARLLRAARTVTR